MDTPKVQRERSFELFRTIVWAQRRAGDDWIRTREISSEQAFVIGYLVENPGAIQRDIAQATRTTASNVSILVQGLERRSLVERRADENDVRIKRVYATEAGAELIEGLQSAMARVDETILTSLTPTERHTLETLLDKVVSQLPEPTGS